MNKVVRLPDGRFITRKLVESDPAALAKAKPEEIWHTGDGRDILIRDMDVMHLVNALRVQTQQAYSKMKMLGLLSPIENMTVDGELSAAVVDLVLDGQRCQDVIKFAMTTMPRFAVMRNELEIRMGRKQRAPEPVQEATARKFDFES